VRVCFVIDRLGIAGTETQLLRLIAGLDRSRVAPYLCLLDGEDEASRSLEPDDCPVLRLGVRRLRHPSVLRQAWRFARFLRKERIDAVQMHFPDSLYFAGPVAKIAGVPHILRTRRDLGFWMKPADRWLGRLYNRIVTATIANCEACRQAVIEQEGASPDSVAVLVNGIELDRLLSIALPSAMNDRKRQVVGMVANLRPVKGPDVFIRAAATVASGRPDVTFRIAGAGDEESARRLIHELGVEDRVELIGSVRDVPSLLGELDVAVLTSHSEGLSSALLEYMAAARPIVATAVGATVELIEDGVHGLLVPPGNPEAVAGAIERLLADRRLAATLGLAARKRAGQRYSQAAMLRRYEDFYTSLGCRH
jgi:glycosyltransferase involved in cell wall biosynthesis